MPVHSSSRFFDLFLTLYASFEKKEQKRRKFLFDAAARFLCARFIAFARFSTSMPFFTFFFSRLKNHSRKVHNNHKRGAWQ
jgi:hypothetical protein